VNVTPFDLGRCPSVRAADAAATRVALRVLSMLPPRWRVDLPPLDLVTVTMAGPDFALRQSDLPDPTDSIALPIARGTEVGRLTLASSFAARIIDTALGARGTFSSARALGPAERGVLVALVAPVLDIIGWSLGLGPAPPTTGIRARLALRIEGAFGAGVLGLDLAGSASASGDHWRSRAGELPVVARVEIAATAVRAASLDGLAPGDAVVFDGRQAADYLADASGEPWLARLAIGAYVAPLQIDSDGGLELAGDFHMIGTPLERTVAIDREGAMDVSGPTEKATSALAAAPIEVVAELARITLRGDEVLGLAPGVVLTVAVDRRQAIALRVGGEIWAEGELVDVDGQLGIRVTRMLETRR
jgi:flagellar motor switch/type III secretory pathway protein FliN